MIPFSELKELDFSTRYATLMPEPIQDLGEMVQYEEYKWNPENTNIVHKNIVQSKAKIIEPFIRGSIDNGINPERKTLEFLKISRTKEDFMYTVRPYQNYDAVLEAYKNEDLDWIEKFGNEKEYIVRFFIGNFGLDFTQGHYYYKLDKEDPWSKSVGPIKYGHLVNHICGLKTLALPNFKQSKILKISVNAAESYNKITDLALSDMIGIVSGFLKIEPFYLERSRFWDGNANMYFLPNKYLSDKKKIELELYFFKTFKFKIHIQKSNEIFELPLGGSYTLRGSYDLGNHFRIKQRSIAEIFEFVQNKKEQSSSGIEKKIGSLYEGEVVEKIDTLAGYGRYSGFQVDRSKVAYEVQALSKFSYGKGTRFYTQPKLAVWCASRDFSEEQFINLAIECHDGSSKDMNRWSPERIDRYLSRMYRWAEGFACKLDPTKNSTVDFVNGKKRYQIRDNRSQTFLDEASSEKKFREYLSRLYNQKFKSKRQRGAWKDIFINDTVSLYKFILRSKNYHDKSNKKYQDSYKALNNGVLLPKTMLSDLARHLKTRTDLQKILYFLQEFNFLSKIEINGYSSSYKKKVFGTHYKPLSSIQECRKVMHLLYGRRLSSYPVRSKSVFSCIYSKDYKVYRTLKNQDSKVLCKLSINYMSNVRSRKRTKTKMRMNLLPRWLKL